MFFIDSSPKMALTHGGMGLFEKGNKKGVLKKSYGSLENFIHTRGWSAFSSLIFIPIE